MDLKKSPCIGYLSEMNQNHESIKKITNMVHSQKQTYINKQTHFDSLI